MGLYHLTPADNADAIRRDGIKADDEGYIYLFTDKIVAGTIAENQVFTARYTLFQVLRRGIVSELEPDEVAELSRGFQRRVKQPSIARKDLRDLGTFDTITAEPSDWDYMKGFQLGCSPKWIKAEHGFRWWCHQQEQAGADPDAPAIRAEMQRRRDELNRLAQASHSGAT